MKRIRIRVIILALWLAVLYNAERLLNPININSITYAFVLVMVVIILVIPKLVRIPLWIILTLQIIAFLLLKALAGTFEGPSVVVYTVTEIFALTSTTLLAHWVSLALSEFEIVVENISIGRRDKASEPASMGQSSIYREVRRARNHRRPLILLSVEVKENSINFNLDRMVKEVQLAMMKQYKLASLSKILCDELEDCSVIVQSNDHFLVALPETTPEEMPFVVKRLRQQVADQAGVELKIGTATLPQDSYSFEGLVDKATREMEADQETIQFIELEEKSLEHYLS
jgi:hypothetical protein